MVSDLVSSVVKAIIARYVRPSMVRLDLIPQFTPKYLNVSHFENIFGFNKFRVSSTSTMHLNILCNRKAKPHSATKTR